MISGESNGDYNIYKGYGLYTGRKWNGESIRVDLSQASQIFLQLVLWVGQIRAIPTPGNKIWNFR